MRAALLIAALLLLPVASASAEVVPGESIAGVEIGMKRGEVKRLLGQPDEVRRPRHEIFGRFIELRYGRLKVGLFRSDRTVFSVRTTSRRERTASGVGVGTRKRGLRRRLEGERCERLEGFRHCFLGRFEAGEIVMDFILTRSNRVKAIRLIRVID